jgi:hypothetical protein
LNAKEGVKETDIWNVLSPILNNSKQWDYTSMPIYGPNTTTHYAPPPQAPMAVKSN